MIDEKKLRELVDDFEDALLNWYENGDAQADIDYEQKRLGAKIDLIDYVMQSQPNPIGYLLKDDYPGTGTLTVWPACITPSDRIARGDFLAVFAQEAGK